MRIPTVKVKKDSPRGWSIINEADFDPEKHVLFEQVHVLEMTDMETGGTIRYEIEEPPVVVNPAAPDDFDSMGKDDLHEILDAHGVEYDGRTGVAKLREMAKRTVFVGL